MKRYAEALTLSSIYWLSAKGSGENRVQLPEHYGETLLSRITFLFHCADSALHPSEIGLLQMQLQTKENIYA